jgi:hypothetical protein
MDFVVVVVVVSATAVVLVVTATDVVAVVTATDVVDIGESTFSNKITAVGTMIATAIKITAKTASTMYVNCLRVSPHLKQFIFMVL